MKINNFDTFILESKIVNLLLESKIEYSDEFINALKLTDHPVSKKLLDLHKKDKDIQFNFIKLGKKDDEISFTQDRRSQQLLKDEKRYFVISDTNRYLTSSAGNQVIYDLLEFERPQSNSDLALPSLNDKVKILRETTSPSSGRTYCLVEYLEGDKLGRQVIVNKQSISEIVETPNIYETSRNEIKIGRFARAFLTAAGETFTDKDISEFVDKYKSTIQILNDAFLRFDVVDGEKLLHFYHVDNYQNQMGTLGNSCMRDADEEILEIYWSNPEVCKLVILYSEQGTLKDGKFLSDKIVGRALLWKTMEGDMFMDRIYTSYQSDEDLFQRFAFKNGWFSRVRQQSSASFTVTNGTSNKSPIYNVQLNKRHRYHTFPYLDSLKYFSPHFNRLTNGAGEFDYFYVLEDTDGGFITSEDY